jgi:succinyl-diaminopimelate desuccinylase
MSAASAIGSARDAVELTAELVRQPTAGAGEATVAGAIAARLHGAGASVQLVRFADGRSSLVARAGAPDRPALCLSGHLDTVGVQASAWSYDPFGAERAGGRLYGRGTSDMKSGVAAMVIAFEHQLAARSATPVVLALSCAEETGCGGAASIVPALGPVGALLVGEPTGLRVALGHRGALWISATAHGRSAHGSKPALGDNAIDRALRFVAVLSAAHAAARLSGVATLSVGTIGGGSAVNIVPHECTVEIDLRLDGALGPEQVIGCLQTHADAVGAITIDTQLALPAVGADRAHAWVAAAIEALGQPPEPPEATYFTDAAVLCPRTGEPPVLICGPGDAGEAHTADESCPIDAISHAVELYRQAIDLYGRN